MMSRYGLQLRKSLAPARPSLLPPAPGFGVDADEDDVEREIARQAAVNRAKKEVEATHKKALEEDASIFDYDGAHEKFKVETVQLRLQDRAERKPKYIQKLLDKAKEREREHEIIYEKKLLKERSKEDHLFADKEKFVTSAYKKKLAERAKWLEEGASVQETQEHASPGRAPGSNPKDEADAPFRRAPSIPRPSEPAAAEQTSVPEKAADVVQPPEEHKTGERYKRSEDAVAAARERYLARKRAREQ